MLILTSILIFMQRIKKYFEEKSSIPYVENIKKISNFEEKSSEINIIIENHL